MIHLDEQGFIAQCRLEDQRLLAVQPQLYHRAQLGIGPKPPMQDAPVFTDTWDFPDEESALKALETWNPEETPEPQGWHRHPGTGRYRIDGNADLEYVKDCYEEHKDDKSGAIDIVKMNAGRAVQLTHGRDRTIEDIEETTTILGEVFPEGTRCFVVTSESSECEHPIRCQWIDHIYHYLDRSVVIRAEDLRQVSIATIRRRLTDQP